MTKRLKNKPKADSKKKQADSKKNVFSVKNIIIWGVPALILLVLLILLFKEVTTVKSDVAEGKVSQKQELSTESINSEVGTDEQSAEQIEKIDYTSLVEEEREFKVSAGENKPKPDEEWENSYLLEKTGRQIWELATRDEILSKPDSWKTILVQNKDKINYTIAPDDARDWKVMVNTGRKLIVKPIIAAKNKGLFKKPRKKRYALQLLSIKNSNLKQAVSLVNQLVDDGYYAYLYRTKEQIRTGEGKTKEYYYRLRTGFYDTEEEALEIGREIKERYGKQYFTDKFWPVLPGYDEISGELINFGTQRTNPWMLQLENYKNKDEAIADLKYISVHVDFSYISQKKDLKTGEYYYRTKIGFFESKRSAKAVLKKLRVLNSDSKLFKAAKALEVKSRNTN